MKDDEVAKIEYNVDYFCDEWHTLQIFSLTTKKKLSEYGPFNSYEEATTFAQEHHISL